MPTKPIPAGSCNFPVNMPIDLRREAGRLAYQEGKSLGAFLREHLERVVEEAYRTGKLVDRAAQRSLEIAGALVVLLGVAAVSWACFSGDNDPRAFRRVTKRRRRDEVCEIVEA